MASTSSAFSDFATFFEKAVALGLRLFWRVCLTLQFLGRSGRERTEACITISCRGIKHVLTCTRKEKQVRHASACPGQSPSPGKLLNCEKQYVFEFENKGTRTATYISAYKTLQKIVQDICIFGTSRTWEACRSFGKFKLCCTTRQYKAWTGSAYSHRRQHIDLDKEEENKRERIQTQRRRQTCQNVRRLHTKCVPISRVLEAQAHDSPVGNRFHITRYTGRNNTTFFKRGKYISVRITLLR